MTTGLIKRTRDEPPVPINRPTVRTTYQLAAEIDLLTGGAEATFLDAIKVVLRWLESKKISVPKGAWRGSGFYSDTFPKVECIQISELGLWTIRLDEFDRPFRDQQASPGRTWSTDISLVKRAQSIALGVRVQCTSMPFAQAQVVLTRPRVVIDLSDAFTLRACAPVKKTPWLISSEEDVSNLHNLLLDPQRQLPICVLTQPDSRAFSVPVLDYMLDPQSLAKRAVGIAYIVQMPWKLGFKWTETVGKAWSVYLGAVRTYMPGIDFDADTLSSHPSVMAEAIVMWQHGGKRAEDGFAEFLLEKLHYFSASKRVSWGDRLFVTDARTKATEIARQKLVADLVAQKDLEHASIFGAQLEKIQLAHTAEIDALKGKIKEIEKESEEFNNDALQAYKDREYYANENNKLRGQLSCLRMNLESKNGQPLDQTIPLPDTFDDFSNWVELHLLGRVVLHPRALRALKNAAFSDVNAAAKALLLLANEYRNMKLNVSENAKEVFDQAMKAQGLRISGSIAQHNAGQEGDTYYVQYPIGSQQRKFVDLHLRSKGNSREPSRCLAIYFFWDDATDQVVVASMPGHLDNRLT